MLSRSQGLIVFISGAFFGLSNWSCSFSIGVNNFNEEKADIKFEQSKRVLKTQSCMIVYHFEFSKIEAIVAAGLFFPGRNSQYHRCSKMILFTIAGSYFFWFCSSEYESH